MKTKGLIRLLLVAAVFFIMAGCAKEPATDVDEDLLAGRWKQVGTEECWRFDSSHEGETWDLSDDVQEGEGIKFTWTVAGAELTCVMRGQMGQVVPKVYTVTTLNAALLVWNDDYGNVKTFNRI